MKLENLKEVWKNNFDSAVQTDIWDGVAHEYAVKPIPDMEKDVFLKYMTEKGVVNKDNTFLDIGCGSGIYSLALSPYVKSVSGCDLSPKMIESAKERAGNLMLTNTDFRAVDWYNDDISELGYEKNFDVAFAKLTPAVADYDTLEKMLACVTKYCFIQKNTRRSDMILDEVFNICGLGGKDISTSDSLVSDIYAYLWLSGYTPEVKYHNEKWNVDRTWESSLNWNINRVKAKKDITDTDIYAIEQYLQSFNDNGIVHEVVNNTIVTISWSMER